MVTKFGVSFNYKGTNKVTISIPNSVSSDMAFNLLDAINNLGDLPRNSICVMITDSSGRTGGGTVQPSQVNLAPLGKAESVPGYTITFGVIYSGKRTAIPIKVTGTTSANYKVHVQGDDVDRVYYHEDMGFIVNLIAPGIPSFSRMRMSEKQMEALLI